MRLINISYCHLELSMTDVNGADVGFQTIV